jgi:transcriptional regulator with XRE-family HTH domain
VIVEQVIGMPDQTSFYKRVGQLIREARNRAELSQEDLGSAAHLRRSSISNIENGRQHILVHTLVEISDALGVEPETLLPGRSQGEMPLPVAELQKHSKSVQAFIEKALPGGTKKQGK